MAQSDYTLTHGTPATQAPAILSGLMALGDKLHAAFISLRYAPQEERSLPPAPKGIDKDYLRDIDMSVDF
jgi:hypothetical protein